MTPTDLHLVDGADGTRVSFGKRQATWLVEQGHVELVKREDTGPRTGVCYNRAELSGQEVQELVQAEPSMRECDLCGFHPAVWEIPVAPFEITKGPVRAPFNRSVIACFMCQHHVTARDVPQLVTRRLSRTADLAVGMGMPRPDYATLRAVAGPMVQEFARAVVRNKTGKPVRVGGGG